MQSAALKETDGWAMSERRERAVMRDVPETGGSRAGPPDDDFRLPTGRGILSKAEIQALLRPDIPTINETERTEPPRPLELDDRFPEDKGEPTAEARQIAARLSLAFGQSAGLKVAVTASRCGRISGFSGTQASAGMMPGAACACFAGADGDISHLLHLPAAMTHALIAHVCGGKAGAPAPARGLSAIDCALLEQLVAPLSIAFAPGARLAGIEIEAGYVGSILPVQSGEETCFSLKLPGGEAQMSLIRLDNAGAAGQPVSAGPQKKPVTAVLTARIASLSVPVSRLSSLKPGDTLLLGLPADQPVELLSGGRDGLPAFEGDIGRKGTNMAVRIRRPSR